MPSRAVEEVKPVGNLRLSVRFADGISGEVHLKESHLRGVFERLRDPAFFRQVHCEHGFVQWPDDIDLAPDAMYEEIKVNGCWILN
jgi:hypothetical protein